MVTCTQRGRRMHFLHRFLMCTGAFLKYLYFRLTVLLNEYAEKRNRSRKEILLIKMQATTETNLYMTTPEK